MKKILVQFNHPTFENNVIFNKPSMNNLNAGWIIMKKQLADMGYDLMTADNNDLTDCAGIIFMNADSVYHPPQFAPVHFKRDLYAEGIAAGLRDKMILVSWEPQTVLPLNYDPKMWALFDHIFVWDEELLKKDARLKRFTVPMEGNPVREKPVPFNEKKLLVSISINKYSSYKYELYSARRKTSWYFTKHYPNDFDLFGLRWNKPVIFIQKLFPFIVKHYSTYRGMAEDKLDTLSKYKFNLCYENTSDAVGYVCDKIFTSFHAKSVPIYWGAPDVKEHIDSDVFIDRRDFKTEADLAKFLINMTEKEYNAYLSAAERYMKSEKYARFLPENYSKPFIETLKLKNN